MKNFAAWLLGAWAMLLTVGLWLYSLNQLRPFDPHQQLAQAAASAGFDRTFADLLHKEGIGPGSLVHLTTTRTCYCDTLSSGHGESLLSALPEESYQLKTLIVDPISDLGKLVPSIPALAVIGQDGNLKYLGPYAVGYGCLSGNTLSKLILSQLASVLPGALINTDASGCFCAMKG